MHDAAVFLARDTTRPLLQHAATCANSYDSLGNTPLIYAARARSTYLLSMFLESPRVDVNLPSLHGVTPFRAAALNCREGAVKLWLDRGRVDIASELSNGQGRGLIGQAVHRGCKCLVRLYLDAKSAKPPLDINTPTKFGLTLLSAAVNKRRGEIVELPLDMGADPSVKEAAGCTAACLAVSRCEEMLPLVQRRGGIVCFWHRRLAESWSVDRFKKPAVSK